jgi:hypothetical protein
VLSIGRKKKRDALLCFGAGCCHRSRTRGYRRAPVKIVLPCRQHWLAGQDVATGRALQARPTALGLMMHWGLLHPHRSRAEPRAAGLPFRLQSAPEHWGLRDLQPSARPRRWRGHREFRGHELVEPVGSVAQDRSHYVDGAFEEEGPLAHVAPGPRCRCNKASKG